MNKTTIELRRYENHPCGYGKMNLPNESSSEILDRIIEWAQKPENIGQKVYRHLLRFEEEKGGELGEYDFSKGGWNAHLDRGHGIQRCHLVIYLDIYHQ